MGWTISPMDCYDYLDYIDYLDWGVKKALMAGWRPFSEGGSPMEQENFSLQIHGIWDLA